MSFHQKLLNIPKIEDCLPGRPTPISISGVHAFNGNEIIPPFPEEMGSLVVGMGCLDAMVGPLPKVGGATGVGCLDGTTES